MSPNPGGSDPVRSTNKRSKTTHAQVQSNGTTKQSAKNTSSVATMGLQSKKVVEQNGLQGGQIRERPKLFWKLSTLTWVTEKDLGTAASSAITTRFNDYYLSQKGKRELYAAFVDKEKPGRDMCVSRAIIRRYRGTTTFAGGRSDRACDACVRGNRLYARLVDGDDGKRSLGFYPLPRDERIGRYMEELSHWVRGG